MPAGYEIRKWSFEDNAGKHTAHAVLFQGKSAFGQNKTFKSLTDARKAVKEHADTQRLRKQIKEERAHLAKHGNLGKTGYIKPKAKAKPKTTKKVKTATKAQTASYAAKLKAERKASETSPKRVYNKDYKPATTWAQFQKINASQIAKHTKGLKDSAESKRQFGTDLAIYGNILDKVWLTTKQKASKTVKPQTTKRKKRSAQKTMSGKTKPQKKPKKRVKKCVRVKVKPHTRTCPTTTR